MRTWGALLNCSLVKFAKTVTKISQTSGDSPKVKHQIRKHLFKKLYEEKWIFAFLNQDCSLNNFSHTAAAKNTGLPLSLALNQRAFLPWEEQYFSIFSPCLQLPVGKTKSQVNVFERWGPPSDTWSLLLWGWLSIGCSTVITLGPWQPFFQLMR